jgi:hypothetical protein
MVWHSQHNRQAPGESIDSLADWSPDWTIGEHVRGCAFESRHVQVSFLYLSICRVEKDDAASGLPGCSRWLPD